jgi:metal-dependent amidase/aminoacylase/carboxypeptidase family protein
MSISSITPAFTYEAFALPFSPPSSAGYLAEYDALPGLGHACGHNIIGTASVLAGVALNHKCNVNIINHTGFYI